MRESDEAPGAVIRHEQKYVSRHLQLSMRRASIVMPTCGLTNRKRWKSNWRNSISRRQWSPRRIIARARTIRGPAVLSKNYAEIGFDGSPPNSIRHGQRIRRVARITLTIILSPKRARGDAKLSGKLRLTMPFLDNRVERVIKENCRDGMLLISRLRLRTVFMVAISRTLFYKVSKMIRQIRFYVQRIDFSNRREFILPSFLNRYSAPFLLFRFG